MIDCSRALISAVRALRRWVWYSPQRSRSHGLPVPSGVAPYRPNSLDGGCPFQAGAEDRAFVEVSAVSAGVKEVRAAIDRAPVDITVGGWGQDGHVAYNQARRHPFHHATLEDIANCTIRIQENNIDTIIALAQRTFGAAYQFVPPMSITLGIRECLSAKKVRVYSDTGAWKQTALRVALFSAPTPEYPMTLLQSHPDAIITATLETARHPISENPEWELF